MTWCKHCQANYDEDHYDENDEHRVGRSWGPTGHTLAIESELRNLCSQRMTDGKDGGMVDADTIWPSEVLEILNRTEDPA